jgi:hypothetical protein
MQAGRADIGAGAALNAVHEMISLHILIVVFPLVHISVAGQNVHRTDLRTAAAADAGGVFHRLVLISAESQQSVGALGGAHGEIVHGVAHHGAAHEDLFGLRYEAAGVLKDIGKRRAHADDQVLRLLDAGPATVTTRSYTGWPS